MAELSVVGISRNFRGRAVPFVLGRDVLSNAARPTSLRANLTTISTLPVKKLIPDCFATIDQAYLQIWTHIVVRVKLIPQDVGHLPTPLERWQDYWKMGVEAIWNRRIPTSFPSGAFHKTLAGAESFWRGVEEDAKLQSGDPDYWNKHWAASRNGELPCRVLFELEWVESDEHHAIHAGNIVSQGGSDESSWKLLPTGEGLTLTGAAHEFGHMLGFAHDRIPPNGCEVETPTQLNTFANNSDLSSFPWRRTVMCAVAVYGQLPSHLVQPFVDNIGSNIQLITVTGGN
jgi:hypothetical protein